MKIQKTKRLGMIWDKAIAPKYNYDKLNDNDIEFLKQHSQRFEEKYRNKVSAIATPELELGIATIFTFLSKVKLDNNVQGNQNDIKH
mgnify:CR=1 FL=1